MNVKEKLVNLGGLVLGLGFLVLLFILMTIFIKGTSWVAVTVLPVLSEVLVYLGGISIFILMPLALIKKVRIVSVVGLGITAYLAGLYLWLTSFLVVYSFWGVVGSAIGLFMAGVGVIPLAFIASLFNGAWSVMGDLAYNLVCTIVLFMLTGWIGSKLEGGVSGR